MKIRCDFVTNSSSSNFIFVFENIDSWHNFLRHCELYDYEDVADVIRTDIILGDTSYDKNGDVVRGKEDMKYKQEILDIAYNFMSHDIKTELLEEKLKGEKFKDYVEEIKRKNSIADTEEFKNRLFQEMLDRTNWEEVETKIKRSDIVVKGTLWDTDGGVLPWAFRNGLPEQEFYTWCVLNFKIG